MTKSKKIFKKRKNVGKKKQRVEEFPAPNEIPEDRPTSPSSASASSRASSLSSSGRKLEPSLPLYQKYEDSTKRYDIIDIEEFASFLKPQIACKVCGGEFDISIVRRIGLACEIWAKCAKCGTRSSFFNSKKVDVKDEVNEKNERPNKPKKLYELNLRMVYAMRSIGKGRAAATMFCAMINLPKPTRRFFILENVLKGAVIEESKRTMKEAVEEAVEMNEGNRNIAIALDGTWQKRGHSSLNGVVTASSVDTGKILDVEILSKYCKCPGKNIREHEPSCSANFQGVSGAMEVNGVLNIFRRSVDTYNVKYKSYLGDGDSKGYKAVVEEKIYGPDFEIEKLECVGHVQKRMGTRLRALKQSTKGKLSDNKPLGGKNRLTDDRINQIQQYYGNAIRRNPGNLEAMKKDVWACFFHISSSNEQPVHGLCPTGENSWCKYRKAVEKGEYYDHNAHFHLPYAVMSTIKPVFQRLADPSLLSKCLHGGTQNPNESANNSIWTTLPKNTFVALNTLKLGTYEALGCFNVGNILKCQVYERLGIEPGYVCSTILKDLDLERITKAERSLTDYQRRARQKASTARKKLEEEFQRSEDPNHPSYGAGMH